MIKQQNRVVQKYNHLILASIARSEGPPQWQPEGAFYKCWKASLYTGDTGCGGRKGFCKGSPGEMVGDSSSPSNIYMAQHRPKHGPSNGFSPKQKSKQMYKRKQTLGINLFHKQTSLVLHSQVTGENKHKTGVWEKAQETKNFQAKATEKKTERETKQN